MQICVCGQVLSFEMLSILLNNLCGKAHSFSKLHDTAHGTQLVLAPLSRMFCDERFSWQNFFVFFSFFFLHFAFAIVRFAFFSSSSSYIVRLILLQHFSIHSTIHYSASVVSSTNFSFTHPWPGRQNERAKRERGENGTYRLTTTYDY